MRRIEKGNKNKNKQGKEIIIYAQIVSSNFRFFFPVLFNHAFRTVNDNFRKLLFYASLTKLSKSNFQLFV